MSKLQIGFAVLTTLKRQVCPKCGYKYAEFGRMDTVSKHPLAELITNEVRIYQFKCLNGKCKTIWTVKVHITKGEKPRYQVIRR